MDWTSIVAALIAFLGGGGVSGTLALILKRRWDKQDSGTVSKADVDSLINKVDRMSNRIDALEKKVDDNTALTKAVAYSQKVTTTERVRYLGLCYMGSGEITIDDKATLKEMYKSGKALGIDGDLDGVMEEVEKLPVTEARFRKGGGDK